MSSSWSLTFRTAATRVIPLGLLVGACMETFMIQTGFYKVAVRKANEREVENREGIDAVVRASRQKSSGSSSGKT